MTLNYIYETDTEQGQFIKLPKSLFLMEELKKLSTEAKVLYSFLLDRVSLSKINGWVDKTGRVYVCYTVEEAVEVLGKSRSTILRVFQELEGKLELIKRKKRGQGKADLIFVKKWDDEPVQEGENSTEKQQKFSTIPMKKEPEIVVEKSNVDFLKCQIDTSRSINLKPLEVSDSAPIKTYLSQTEQNQTELSDSLPPSTPSTQKKSTSRGSERVNSPEIKIQVHYDLERAFDRGTEGVEDLFYRYLDDKVRMTSLVYHLGEFYDCEEKSKDYDEYSKEMLLYTSRKLYCEALTQLLLEKNYTNVKGASISYSKVVERLVPYVQRDEFGDENVNISSVMGNTVRDFMDASKSIAIKHPLAYMKSCIWSTLVEGTVKSEMNFQRASANNWVCV